jgi:hypothetical protein
MQAANNILNQWGPALLVCFTVIIGLFYQNTRMSDFKGAIDKRFDDLKDYIKSEFRRVDERIDRLESPLARK